jgi:tRNA 2-thiouridine synthesizing protein D
MMNMDSNVAMKLAKAAQDKGYEVMIFGYGEGIFLIKEGQEPKRFPNVGKESKELVEKGGDIIVCETCCAARGMHRGEEISGTKIGSITNDMSRLVAKSDRLVTIAR